MFKKNIFKELQDYNWKLLLCLPQKQAETQPSFWTAIFQNKFSVCQIRLNVYLQKTNIWNLSSLEMQRKLIKSKVYNKLFYSVWREGSHKPLKTAAVKKSFPSVYIINA